MRKVLTTGTSADNPNPFLPLMAVRILAKIDPSAIELCRQRREELERERAEIAEYSRVYWSQGEGYRLRTDRQVRKLQEQGKTSVTRQDGNVVSVEIGGPS